MNVNEQDLKKIIEQIDPNNVSSWQFTQTGTQNGYYKRVDAMGEKFGYFRLCFSSPYGYTFTLSNQDALVVTFPARNLKVGDETARSLKSLINQQIV